MYAITKQTTVDGEKSYLTFQNNWTIQKKYVKEFYTHSAAREESLYVQSAPKGYFIGVVKDFNTKNERMVCQRMV